MKATTTENLKFLGAIAAGLAASALIIAPAIVHADDAALVQAAANCKPVLEEAYSSEDERNAAYEDCIDIEYRKLANPEGGAK